MFEYLFLADADVKPCEVVKFEYVSTEVETYHVGTIYHYKIRARGNSARFEDGRLYIVRHSAFPGQKPQIEYGFNAEYATLVRKEYEEKIASGETVEGDYSDKTLEVGVFYPSEERAISLCETISNSPDGRFYRQ